MEFNSGFKGLMVTWLAHADGTSSEISTNCEWTLEG